MTQEQKTKISEHFDKLHAIVSDYGLNVPNDIRDALRAAYLAGADYALDIYSPHWISVEEDGNPIDSGWYIFTIGKIVDVGYYLGGNEWRDVHPTHWMPKPQPPKEGGEK